MWRLLLLLWFGSPALAGSDCIALASREAEIVPVVSVPVAGVTIRYLAHAMFALTLPDGMMAVTDYNGEIGDALPAVVTMNHYHETHYTAHPDPRIPVVLKGWGSFGHPAAVDLDLGPLHIRNVTTDLRGPFGEGGEADGNSIFIFEAEGLCIVHLGHLHQRLSAAKRAMIGRVDVLMVPVDGGFTMDQGAMAEEVRSLHPRLVLPMHWFTEDVRSAFLAKLGYPVRATGPEVTVTRETLPQAPEVLVLTPALFPRGLAR